jgi:hypothetical protein
MPKSEKSKCLVPKCGRDAKSRGLCLKDYKVVAKLVNAKETTWEKLESAGKVSSLRRASSKAWFTGKA